MIKMFLFMIFAMHIFSAAEAGIFKSLKNIPTTIKVLFLERENNKNDVFDSQAIRDANRNVLSALSCFDNALKKTHDLAKSSEMSFSDSVHGLQQTFQEHIQKNKRREVDTLDLSMSASSIGLLMMGGLGGFAHLGFPRIITSSDFNKFFAPMLLGLPMLIGARPCARLLVWGHRFIIPESVPDFLSTAAKVQMLNPEIPVFRQKIRDYRDTILCVTPHIDIESSMSLPQAIKILKTKSGIPEADAVIKIIDDLESAGFMPILDT